MNNELEIKIIENKNNHVSIALSGNINLNSIDFLSNNIKEIKKKYNSKYYIFKIDKLSYVSSGGIGIFMDLFDNVEKKGGKICFIGMQSAVKRVFELIGFLQYFGDAQTEDEALEYIKK